MTASKGKSNNYSGTINELIKREEKIENKIVVNETKTLSPQLKELNERLKDKGIFRSGGLCGIKENGIAVHVSQKSKKRALLILNELSKAFQKRGFKFGVGDYYNYSQYNDNDRDYTLIEINEVKIRLKLKEKQNRKAFKNLTDIDDEELRNCYRYSFKSGDKILIPNGILSFSVDDYTDNPCTRRWEDEDKLPLEQKLNKLIQDLIIISEEIKIRNLRIIEIRRQEQIQLEIRLKKEKEENAFAKRMEVIRELGLNSIIYEQVKSLKSSLDLSSENHSRLAQWIDEYLETQVPTSMAINKLNQPMNKNNLY